MEYIPLWERDARKEGEKIGEKRGKKEGKEEGKEEGKKEGKKEIAKQMLLDNMPIEKVIKYTGLTEKEIKALIH